MNRGVSIPLVVVLLALLMGLGAGAFAIVNNETRVLPKDPLEVVGSGVSDEIQNIAEEIKVVAHDPFQKKERESKIISLEDYVVEDVLEEEIIEPELEPQDTFDPGEITEELTPPKEEEAIISEVSPEDREVFALNPEWSEVLVNLFCTDGRVSKLKGSGSGAIIDSRGVILTNAHVAIKFIQDDWLEDTDINSTTCTVRIGSPAQPRYKAKLLYIPDAYVKNSFSNAYTFSDDWVVYGQDDYALLLITERTSGKALPAVFPHLKVRTDDVFPGTFTYLSGYPASFLGWLTMLKHLNITSSPAYVRSIATLGGGFIDIITFDGTIASQPGISGGVVIANGGEIVGLPTFTDGANQSISTSDNVLNAITLGYVNRDLKLDSGLSLKEFLLQRDLNAVADTFEEKVREYQCLFSHTVKVNQGFTLDSTCE